MFPEVVAVPPVHDAEYSGAVDAVCVVDPLSFLIGVFVGLP